MTRLAMLDLRAQLAAHDAAFMAQADEKSRKEYRSTLRSAGGL